MTTTCPRPLLPAAAPLAVATSAPGRPRPSARPSPTHGRSSAGLVIASVAHELRSPLTSLIANLGFTTAELAEAKAAGRAVGPAALGELLGALRDALDAADCIRSICGELRTLSTDDDVRAGAARVSRAVERALTMTRGELLPRARLALRLDPVPPVRGSEARLVQVLTNLLVNATQAIPAGAPGQHMVTVSAGLAGRGRIALEVGDTGCGIAPEILPRIFEPFFTTKPPGTGTGLGLAVCRDIVTALDGDIEVESEVGRGTTVRVLLPIAARDRGPELPPSHPTMRLE